MAVFLLAGPSLAESNEKFLTDAINTNDAEIAIGKLAMTKARSPAVRSYAEVLVTDHTKGNVEAKAVARELHIKPPVGLPAAAKADYTKLKGLTGTQFDQEFVGMMVAGHKQAIAEFQDQAKTGSKPTASLANATLPTLEKHLTMGEALVGKQ
jgi:putative membrane protein